MLFTELIINPKAGNSRAENQLPQLIAAVASQFDPLHQTHTKEPGDAGRIAKDVVRAHAEKNESVQLIVIGGDGTLHDVINGLQSCGRGDVAVGYIPTGTGDDFARANGILLDPLAAANALKTAKPRAIQVGKADTREFGVRYFINNFGIGIDALVVYSTNHSKTKNLLNALKLGSTSYLLHFATALAHQKAFTSTWETTRGAHPTNKAYLCVFTNHPYLGGGIRLIMPEDDDRSSLHLVEVHKEKWYLLAQMLVAILKHKPKHPLIHHYTAPAFDFETSAKEHIQVDGEELEAPVHARLSQVQQVFLLPAKA